MSYQFTGSSSHKISYPLALNGTTQLTLSFWAKWTGSWGGAIGSVLDGNYGWGIGNTNTWDKISVRVRNYNGKEFLTTNSVGTSVDTTWNHYYVVYDGSLTEASRFRLWVNGTEITAFDSATAGASIPADTTTIFGNTVGSGGADYFTGKLAEVAMWIGEAITTGTVISDLASGVIASTARPTGLDFHVRMNSSGDVNDSAGSLTGTVTGATYSSDHPTMAGGGGSTFVPQVMMVL